jgi:hypothetical protein
VPLPKQSNKDTTAAAATAVAAATTAASGANKVSTLVNGSCTLSLYVLEASHCSQREQLSVYYSYVYYLLLPWLCCKANPVWWCEQ